jgi:hypothetical protein
MVDLVEHVPKKVHIMARSVPPIENEGSNEPTAEALNHRRRTALDAKQRPSAKPSIPRRSGEYDNAKLAGIKQDRAHVPARCFRQFPSRECSLQDEKSQCNSKYQP